MKPPKWADKFLEWYCRPDLLEEIQGDAYELFLRTAKINKRRADFYFIWNVMRFFRWKNIRRRKKHGNPWQLTTAMIKNFLILALRNFLRQPGHSFLNLFGLSAGFTCAFLILLWVSHEFSFDRFHADTNRLFTVLTHVEANGNIQTYDVSGFNMDVSSVPEVESRVSLVSGTRWPNELCFRPAGKPNECIYFNGVYSNEALFTTFNFPILYGDPRPLKGEAEIAISEKMAMSLYGSESPLGKTMKIDDWQEVTIVSVFQNLPVKSSIQFDFALPFAKLKKLWGVNDEQLAQNFFNQYIKTNTLITPEQLTEKLNDVRVVSEKYKEQKIRYEAFPFNQWHLNSKFENGENTGGRIDYVWLFLVIGILVVAMAVINFVNMATARASLRAKEIGIRKVTGAHRASLIAQFMSESFLLVFTAFVAALLVTQLVLPFFNELLGEQLSLNLWSNELPFYLAAFLMAITFLAGIYPSLIMSSFQPVHILKGNFSNRATGSLPLRKILMVVQLSVSIGIIIFSGILYRQLNYITKKDLGFDRENMVRVEPTYKLLLSYDVFKNDLMSHSSIESVGASNSNPLNAGGGNTGVDWQGKPKDLRVSFKTIGCFHDFPQTMGLQILEGRDFLPELQIKDTLLTEVLITKDAASVMGLARPVGERIKIADVDCEIIGVVNDFHTASLREQVEPAILYRRDIKHVSTIYIKYKPGQAKAAVAAIDEAYKKIEPAFTMKYWFQDETFNALYHTEIIASRLVLLFAMIALIIAIIGIAGLATFNLMRKTKEIGIRRVFGASVRQVLSLLFSEFLWVLFLALAISIPLTWYASSNWLEGFAYRTNIPWWIFAATLAGIVLLVMSIIWVQGQKTISTNPTKTLRIE
jgi:putative ABC transport system permease protein